MDKVEEQKPLRTPTRLQCTSKHDQSEHVEEDMGKSAMHEKVGDDLKRLKFIRSRIMQGQDISQIDSVYGRDEADTIIANMASHLILPGIMNGRTLEHYQKLIGVESREELGDNGRVHVNKRDLLTSDELSGLTSQN